MNSALKDRACRCPGIDLRGPTFGSMTGCPVSDVAGRCGICRAGEAAAYASKAVSGWAVAAINQTAFRTCLRRVFRIDANQRHALQRRFVGHETPKLGECPPMVRSPLATPNRCPSANMRQVFQSDAASGVFSLAHDRFADAMVYVAGEPRLLGPTSPKQPFCRLGSLPLQV